MALYQGQQTPQSSTKTAIYQPTNEETPPWAQDGYWESLLAECDSLPHQRSAASHKPPVTHAKSELAAAPIATAAPIAIGEPLDGLPAGERDWRLMERGFADSQVFELSVNGFNRGGLLVKYNSLTGFVPSSHLIGLDYSTEDRQLSLGVRVGKPIRLRIIELDRTRNRLIFSERAAEDEPSEPDALSRLQPNDSTTGIVSNLCHFGAFVDLGGGVEGLIHISELSWGRISHPAELLQLGQRIAVHVMDIDRNQRRVGLSLKRLTPDPWLHVEDRYTIGQLVHGRVTNVVSFGAFVRLEEGLEGLIHISELAEGSFLHPRNVIAENSLVSARVISIDPQNRRLALSLRRPQARV